MRLRIGLTLLLSIAVIPASARAQSASGWHIMQDGVAFFTWNHQGGPRGGTDFGVQNWWMGMAEHLHRPFVVRPVPAAHGPRVERARIHQIPALFAGLAAVEDRSFDVQRILPNPAG